MFWIWRESQFLKMQMMFLKNVRNRSNVNFHGQRHVLTVGIDLPMYEVIRSQFAFQNFYRYLYHQ